MAATASSSRASRPVDGAVLGLAIGGSVVCVCVTVALAAGHVAGAGIIAVAATGFLLLVGWCFVHRRVDQAMAALGLYLGLLDGYVKLRTGSTTITLARDVIVLAIASGALLRAMRTDRRLALPPLGGLVIAFGIVVLVELASPTSRGITAGLAGVRQHLEFVPLFFLGYAFIRREAQIQKLLFIIVLCAAVGGVVSYIQSNLTPEQLAGWGPGYRERIVGTGVFFGAGRVAFGPNGASVRPFGLGSEAGAGAVMAALALPALMTLLISAKTRVRLALVPLSVGVGLAIATSGSRAALVTVFVTVVAFGLISAASKNALRAVVGLALCGTLVFVVFQHLGPDNAATRRAHSVAPSKAVGTFTTERGGSVTKFAGLAKAHPLGAGVGSSGPAAGFDHSAPVAGFDSETEWNFLVVEVGLVGVGIYLLLNIKLMLLALTRIRHIGDAALRLKLAALAAPLFGLLVASFAGPTTATVPTAPYLWLVAGILSYWLMTAYQKGRNVTRSLARG
jgi:hypothetical protein